jgi:hypothetical protein
MSNLNGIDYELTLLSGGDMPYTRFQDEVKIDIDSANPDHDTADFWEPIRNAAVATGAFPFAFRIKDVLRHASDYPNDPAPVFPNTGMHFAYTDGGVFQNEPIGLAKQLVDDIDDHLNEDRYYIFVAPGMRASDCNDFSAAPGSSYFDFWNTGKALVNAIFNQARFQDLENVEAINRQIELFDKQADGLEALFLAGTVDAASLGPATLPLLHAMFPPAAGQQLSAAGLAARARLQTQFTVEYVAINQAKGQTNANAFIDAVLLLETVAALGPQDVMKVYPITEDADELAGDDLDAFGGFFDVAYRQHDYDRGRQNVRDFVVWLNQQTSRGLGPINYDVGTLPPIVIDSSLDGVQMSAIDKSKRQALRNALYNRAQDFMEEIGLPWAVREAVDLAYLNGALDKLLAL